MTLHEEIIRASAKVGSPEFQTVTCRKGETVSTSDPLTKTEVAHSSEAITQIAKELTIGLVSTEELLPIAPMFMLIPPQSLLYFVASLFVSAFEAGRAFEQNRQDAAIAEILERENCE